MSMLNSQNKVRPECWINQNNFWQPWAPNCAWRSKCTAKLYNTEYSLYIYIFFTFQRQIFVNLLIRSGVEAESWIMNHGNKTCKNHEFLFKKLENYESLYFGSGIMSNGTLRKAQQNTRMNYRKNEWWYRVWMKQKFEHQRNTAKRD